MNESNAPFDSAQYSRRNFLRTSSTALAGGALLGALPVERFALGASPGDTLKLALIGCGGRGSGAADQALKNATGGVKLVALADVFQDRLDTSLAALTKVHGEKVEVPKENQFVGFDSYKKAMALADVVVLGSPPGFRPYHFEEAVKLGKHVFMEKPVASDAPGVRRILAAAEEAKKKNLKVVVGLQRRYDPRYQETVKRLHDGAVGKILAARCYWNDNGVWVHAREEEEKKAGRKLTEMEYQLRNWYYFTWICGDHIVEQHIHNIDVINWCKQAYPVEARGMGGREVRKGKDYGEIFDHHMVEFTYEDGCILFSQCRHMRGCWNEVSEHVIGMDGNAAVSSYRITGKNKWRYSGAIKDPYQNEHDVLFDAIRNDKPQNDAELGAKSTLTAIMGRMATYSGQKVRWEDALNSKLDLMPERFDWDATPKIVPGADGLYPVPVPGQTEAF
jgi:predicted dehydrogenase